MELTTTLNEIRRHGPCDDGWATLLASLDKTKADDEPLPLLHILESNGIHDAAWALRAVDERHDNAIRLFACFCARYSLDIFEREYPDDKRPRQAIETAERFAQGQATKDELTVGWVAVRAVEAAAGAAAWAAAWDSAWVAAEDAAWAAAGAAAGIAGDAARAAGAAARAAEAAEFKLLCRLEGGYGQVC